MDYLYSIYGDFKYIVFMFYTYWKFLNIFGLEHYPYDECAMYSNKFAMQIKIVRSKLYLSSVTKPLRIHRGIKNVAIVIYTKY